ncbi:Thiol-disulfide isomerase or thioredoxin [Pedobacter rhizosphaerae]|uniref:Thiol-disulfide isomerase or thioredoxin n=2 Tax=Pedobacter rhizosphaerae TaxID=390241 RepID=A0A1H9PNT8_9SPHI|nr:Thiol-disulfide isomerase or thioredoxin [Pedobacter rhizosphaerae]
MIPMKKSILGFLILFSVVLQTQGQSLSINPTKVQRGDLITITYDPSLADGKIAADAPSVTIVFTYSTFYDLPWKMPMIREGNKWKATFVAGRFATFATFYLQNGEEIQKPATDRHYTLPVYDGEKRVKNSLLHESYSLSAQMPKSPNLQANKLVLLNHELINYPDNYEAKVAQLVVKMAMASKPEEKLRFRQEARKIIANKLEENPTLPGNVNLVTMGYLMIGEKTRLDSVRKVIMDRFPDADLSKDLRAGIIAKEKDPKVRVAKLEALLKKSDDLGEEGSEGIHKMLFEYYASVKDAAKALYHASKLYTKANPYTPETFKNISAKLTANEIAPEAAIIYADKSLALADQWPVGIIRYFPEFGHIPSYVADSTRKQAVAEAKSALYSLKALNYIRLQGLDSAKILANKVVKISDGREALINSANVFAGLGENELAFKTLWRLLVKNPTDSVVLKSAKDYFLKYNSSEDAFRTKISELEKLEIAQLQATTKALMMNKPGPELSGLVTLEGKPVTQQMMAGKIVILDFWATWCVPCMQEMPYFHKVYEKYKNNSNVMFMVVNSGSNNTIQDAQKWVKQNPQYKFPVYFNNDKNIGEKLGFTVIPTIAVIDQAGKLQFRTIGFEGEILQKKLDAQISVLLQGKSEGK